MSACDGFGRAINVHLFFKDLICKDFQKKDRELSSLDRFAFIIADFYSADMVRYR